MSSEGSEYLDPKLIQPVIDVAVHYNLIDHPIDAEDLISDLALRQPQSSIPVNFPVDALLPILSITHYCRVSA